MCVCLSVCESRLRKVRAVVEIVVVVREIESVYVCVCVLCYPLLSYQILSSSVSLVPSLPNRI